MKTGRQRCVVMLCAGVAIAVAGHHARGEGTESNAQWERVKAQVGIKTFSVKPDSVTVSVPTRKNTPIQHGTPAGRVAGGVAHLFTEIMVHATNYVENHKGRWAVEQRLNEIDQQRQGGQGATVFVSKKRLNPNELGVTQTVITGVRVVPSYSAAEGLYLDQTTSQIVPPRDDEEVYFVSSGSGGAKERIARVSPAQVQSIARHIEQGGTLEQLHEAEAAIARPFGIGAPRPSMSSVLIEAVESQRQQGADLAVDEYGSGHHIKREKIDPFEFSDKEVGFELRPIDGSQVAEDAAEFAEKQRRERKKANDHASGGEPGTGEDLSQPIATSGAAQQDPHQTNSEPRETTSSATKSPASKKSLQIDTSGCSKIVDQALRAPKTKLVENPEYQQRPLRVGKWIRVEKTPGERGDELMAAFAAALSCHDATMAAAERQMEKGHGADWKSSYTLSASHDTHSKIRDIIVGRPEIFGN